MQPFQSGIKRISLLSDQVTLIPENQFPREIILEQLDAAVLCTGLSDVGYASALPSAGFNPPWSPGGALLGSVLSSATLAGFPS